MYAILNYTATIAAPRRWVAAADMGAGAQGMEKQQTISPVFSGAFPRRRWLATSHAPPRAVAWAGQGIDTIGQSNITGILQPVKHGGWRDRLGGIRNPNLGNVAMDQGSAGQPTPTSPYAQVARRRRGHTYRTTLPRAQGGQYRRTTATLP